MPKDITILCLLQEIKYLKRQIYNTPHLQYTGYCQWTSNRPLRPRGIYSSIKSDTAIFTE